MSLGVRDFQVTQETSTENLARSLCHTHSLDLDLMGRVETHMHFGTHAGVCHGRRDALAAQCDL